MDSRRRRGFTLVELLVVIAIIAILIAMLLPAVQAARESGRRAKCENHLKSIALGNIQHEHSIGWYTTGGWGWGWLGEPDRGYGPRQPGGWTYNILPYVEERDLHDLGKGGNAATIKTTRAKMWGTPVEWFNCPSRRLPVAYPCTTGMTNSDAMTMVARSDYAINSGSYGWCESFPGPGTYTDGDNPKWTKWSDMSHYNGISYERSTVSARQVKDGVSYTYLVGEKNVNPDDYESGKAGGDNEGAYAGFDNDDFRTGSIPALPDMPGVKTDCAFGSAHPGIWLMSFCDGSVKAMSYRMDDTVHANLAGRNDGAVIERGSY